MAGLRKGIQVTNEFDGYEPPEDTRAYGDAYADDSRMMMTEPEVAYTMEDEDEEKREALNNLQDRYYTGVQFLNALDARLRDLNRLFDAQL